MILNNFIISKKINESKVIWRFLSEFYMSKIFYLINLFVIIR